MRNYPPFLYATPLATHPESTQDSRLKTQNHAWKLYHCTVSTSHCSTTSPQHLVITLTGWNCKAWSANFLQLIQTQLTQELNRATPFWFPFNLYSIAPFTKLREEASPPLLPPFPRESFEVKFDVLLRIEVLIS